MNLQGFWRSSRSTIISAVIALVVIAGLFILFNTLPAGETTKTEEEEPTTEEQVDEVKAPEAEEKEDEIKEGASVTLPTKYTVVRGDSLWNISMRFYGTGFNWTDIAQENKLAKPDIIHASNVLKIPKAEAKMRTYTVVEGDSLWSISERFYGTGFDWTKIRDANPGKIGQLPNGRPLITAGQALVVP